MFDVYKRHPVNKTAALVSVQKNCCDELSEEQVRQNLVDKVKKIDDLIQGMPKGDERKRLGREKNELCQKINSIRAKKKCPGVEKYVMDILREELSSFQFKRLLHMASERKDKDDKERRA